MSRTLIIAEAGVNHNGSLDLALELVEKAAWAGADIIKFQTFVAELCVSQYAEKAAYQKKTTGNTESQLDMVKKLELSWQDFKTIKEKCDACGIQFMSTPFDHVSIDFLKNMHMPYWKIPSGEITNLPYLEAIGKLKEPIIMSTGMSNRKEIEEALLVLKKQGAKDITLLHCTTEYPAPVEEVNLNAMNAMAEYFHCPVGYSDHTQGITVPVAAVAMGAAVIEKHFTLDCNMEGPDHKASLEPETLKQMIEQIRLVEQARGNGIKMPSESEKKNILVVRKSIVAAEHIRKGERFTEQNLTVKRPGTGITPMKWREIIGLAAQRDYEKDEMIEE